VAYAAKVREELVKAGIRAELDDRNEKIGYKIRDAQVQKVPYMLVVGSKEVEAGTVAVRHRRAGDQGSMPLAAFIERIRHEIETRSLD